MTGKSGALHLLASADFRRQTNSAARNAVITKLGLNPQLAASWDNNLRNWERRHNPVFAPWIAFAQLPEPEFPARAKEWAAKFSANDDKTKPINPLIARLFANPPSSLAQVAAGYASVFRDVEQRWQEALATAAAPPARRHQRPRRTQGPARPRTASKSGSSCTRTIRRCSWTSRA